MRRLVVLGLLLGLMALLQSLQAGVGTPSHALSVAAFGFVLLAAYTLGQMSASAGLPKITGYIVTGLVFGPQVLNVFSTEVTNDLRVVNDLAIGLIAFGAGAEMQLGNLKKIARSLALIVLIKGALILAAITAAVWALSPFIPFLADQPTALILAVGMILGVLAIGTSPAATIAVISETGAKGRLADTTLGVAVAKDIVMVVLLALAIALASTFSPGGHGFEAEILVDLGKELGLSLIAGVILGFVVIAYMRYVGAELWLFLIGVVFAMTAIAVQFHLEALLTFIVGGFVVQNASKFGHDFVHLVETVALPIFVVFFCAAGAGIDLGALRAVGLVAVALVAVRLAAIWLGTGIATRLAGEPIEVRKNAWLAFVAQAGVVIGLLIIVEEKLPGLGVEIRTLVMGTVAIHLLLGPILFKLALSRAGEISSDATAGPAEASDQPTVAVEQAPLAAELEALVSDVSNKVTAAVSQFTAAVEDGPQAVARALEGLDEDDLEGARREVERTWAEELQTASEALWARLNHTALSLPRQVRVVLERDWFEPARLDLGPERWRKRARRVRRALKRATGSEAALYRTVPFRDVVLYNLDHLLPEDLQPLIASVAAQPALMLREKWAAPAPPPSADDEPLQDPPEEENAVEPLEQMASIIDVRLRQLRRDLALVGTGELPAGKRRPSQIHERSVRAREQTTKAITAWEDFARSVVGYQERRVQIKVLRDVLEETFTDFTPTFGELYAEDVTVPLKRAMDVLGESATRTRALSPEPSDELEQGVVVIGEWTSAELRRQTLAGLRRDLDSQRFDRLSRQLDSRLDELLAKLPERFRVADPADLPDPTKAPRTYPKPAEYEFQLIAKSLVERTVGPSLQAISERTSSALTTAERTTREVREHLELRFESALDAALDERRDAQSTTGADGGQRASALQILGLALDQASGRIGEALTLAEQTGAGVVEQFLTDVEGLEDGLETRLAGARPLEARLQAERARVELQGAVVVRSFLRRISTAWEALLKRIGLHRPPKDRKEARPDNDLRPAGAAGSDRAVLFRLLFDTKTAGGRMVDRFVIAVIIASVFVVMLDSVGSISSRFGRTFLVLEWMFTIVFTIEYAGRLWAVKRPSHYAFSFFGIVDLLALIPTYLSVFLPGGQSLIAIRALRVVRIFRVFKLARYMGEARVLTEALKASRFKITVFIATVLTTAVVVGSIMFVVEGPTTGFTSIPRSVYWSIVTLTTVGYGDISPGTPLGQVLASMLMILGYGIIAVPTGIVSAEVARSGSKPRDSQSVACVACGHLEADPASKFCRVCGGGLTPAIAGAGTTPPDLLSPG